MKLPSSCFKLAASSTLCALAVGCAGVDNAPPTVVRTPPPLNYERTITNYLAFRIRNPQKNAEINVGAPEPGACALDGYITSTRGWVVPVAYATRSGEATGRETIRINAKQYYFWFLGNTIAGITGRIELCPGVGSGFESPTPDGAAPAPTTVVPVSSNVDMQRRGEAAVAEAPKGDRAQDRVKPAGAQKPKATSAPRKSAASSGKARASATKNKAGNSTPR